MFLNAISYHRSPFFACHIFQSSSFLIFFRLKKLKTISKKLKNIEKHLKQENHQKREQRKIKMVKRKKSQCLAASSLVIKRLKVRNIHSKLIKQNLINNLALWVTELIIWFYLICFCSALKTLKRISVSSKKKTHNVLLVFFIFLQTISSYCTFFYWRKRFSSFF